MREEGDYYKIVFLDEGLSVEIKGTAGKEVIHVSSTNYRTGKELIYISSTNHSFTLKKKWVLGVLPFRISSKTLPLLAKDRYMMTPAYGGNGRTHPTIGDMEELIFRLAVGYTYGWPTQGVNNQSVIVERKAAIVQMFRLGTLYLSFRLSYAQYACSSVMQ